MKTTILTAALIGCSSLHAGNTLPADTASVRDIEEIVVVSTPKETNKLREQPVSASLFSLHELETNHSGSLKELSAYVPNFFMPDYGSSLTSAAYIRGIGSRINTPAVGLYVDNVAYADKSAYDIDFLDVERIDILRGPQGTLYGRNTMGGLIRVYTRNPFRYQGTDIRAGVSSRDNRYRFALSHHHRINRHVAFSAGAFYESGRGLYENALTGQPVDELHRTGGRIRTIWLPSDRWKLDFSTDYSYRDEGGYAYRLEGSENDLPEDLLPYAGKISSNRPCFYRRSLLNSSLTATYTADRFTLSAVTAYQNLNDNMTIDQDFTGLDYFSLTQKQRINSVSEEITLKSHPGTRWEWISGAYAMHQSLHTKSLVTLTEAFMSRVFDRANSRLKPSGMELALHMHEPDFVADGSFDTPTTDVAVFHQSTFKNLFSISGLQLTAGLRIEYEKMRLKHNYGGQLGYDIAMTSPMMPLNLDNLSDISHFTGELHHDYLQWLPKVALQYSIDNRNNVYVSWSKGYRSGGYNVQMFSDLVQGDLQSRMMASVKASTEEKLNDPMFNRMPENVKQMILGNIPQEEFTGTPAQTRFSPEYSYNYEVGGHFSFFGNKLQIDAAAFYMDVHDQQISKMVNSGLGRAMVNAGRGRSTGMEIALRGCVADNRLAWNASYGFTHSIFREYETGLTDAEGQAVDYNGNHVPFAPRHTLSAGTDYTFFRTKQKVLKEVTVGADMTGVGEIYWTEDNLLKQPFYALLNAHVTFNFGNVGLDIWGKNLTDTRYDIFCFTSRATMQELRFSQPGRPIQFGADLKVHF